MKSTRKEQLYGCLHLELADGSFFKDMDVSFYSADFGKISDLFIRNRGLAPFHLAS
jgi:hypothetical protein